MNKITLFTFTLIALLGALLAACSGGAAADLSGEWKLVSYGDAANPTPAIPDAETSLSFNEGQFGGTVGCNSFGGDYKVNGDQLTIGSIISTMMFCDQTSAQESAVLALLSDQTVKFQIEGNTLTLSSTDGSSVVKMEKK